MKLLQGFQDRVDRFLWKHPNFGIRNLMLYIVIGNALIYLLSMMDRSSTLVYYLVFSADRVLHPNANTAFLTLMLEIFKSQNQS